MWMCRSPKYALRLALRSMQTSLSSVYVTRLAPGDPCPAC